MPGQQITIHSAADRKQSKLAGALHTRAMKLALSKLGEGAVPVDIDAAVERMILALGGYPAFKGFGGYEYSTCISVNSGVCHCPPQRTTIKNGDVVSIDIGVSLGGAIVDGAVTVIVGEGSESDEILIKATRTALEEGIAKAMPENRVGDISHAIELVADQYGFCPVKEITGHGIGAFLHEDPEIPSVGKAGTGELLKIGMVLAIEPIFLSEETSLLHSTDGWSISALGDVKAAHFEMSISVEEDGPLILTDWRDLV